MSYITYEVVVHSDGEQNWRKEGKLHREDGPAITHPNGSQFWYKEGKLHREDGPAVTYRSGDKRWYLNNTLLTEKEFLERTQPAKELTVAEIEALLGYRVKVVKS